MGICREILLLKLRITKEMLNIEGEQWRWLLGLGLLLLLSFGSLVVALGLDIFVIDSKSLINLRLERGLVLNAGRR